MYHSELHRLMCELDRYESQMLCNALDAQAHTVGYCITKKARIFTYTPKGVAKMPLSCPGCGVDMHLVRQNAQVLWREIEQFSGALTTLWHLAFRSECYLPSQPVSVGGLQSFPTEPASSNTQVVNTETPVTKLT